MHKDFDTSTIEKNWELPFNTTVFVSKTEQVWARPYPMKRHHVYDTRTVILQCKVLEVKGNEFKAVLFGNNGFEKDGETFVFNRDEMLVNQDFKDVDSLGVWSEIKNNN